MRAHVVASLVLVACGAAPRADAPAAATLIVHGGQVFGTDATAVAIVDDAIVAIGSDDEIATWRGAATRLIDADGGTITPGLIDAHCHLYGLGAFADGVDLTATASPEAVAAAAAAARPSPATGSSAAGGTGTAGRSRRSPLTRCSTPPSACARRCCRVDGHAAWLSAEALRRAGIDRDTPDPAASRATPPANYRHPRRQRAGAGRSRDPAADGRRSSTPILTAAARAVEAGLTGVHEMGIDADTVAAYQGLPPRPAAAAVYAFAEGMPPPRGRSRPRRHRRRSGASASPA
ncbi:MAG: amidohydrolase family protein [Kofleriaceae bacterium]